MAVKRIAGIEDLTPDARNANRGTPRGRKELERSLRELGAGRSILADQAGHVIAGNKTLDVAAELGLKVKVVQTDGHELVVVQRTDLDLAKDKRARRLAYNDNRIAELDLDFDPDVIAADLDAGVELDGLWTDDELAALLNRTIPADPAGAQSEADSQAKAFCVKVICESSEHQARVAQELTQLGYECELAA